MNENTDSSESWLSIMDYALRNRVSVSTVRRYIKAQKVKYKTENGKYLIFSTEYSKRKVDKVIKELNWETLKLEEENKLLKRELKRIREENSELKMLVDLYEGKDTLKFKKIL